MPNKLNDYRRLS
ncbi:hypothetical protein VTL71DRAFT_2083 [Oculimacula yallundae]|uniref:Uncharacterized protein n=1 Tax=Oculimacula yallundae TaxID=86028 RepID=A0ABR4C8L3_9HELO